MVVTEGVTVNVLPNEQHEYLMTTKEVAKGYGTTAYSIRQNKVRLGDELVEGKHYVLAVTISHTGLPSALKTAHNAVLWTKRGIVRLGFAMRSPRAKLFRDWAEQLIIQLDERRDLFGAVPVKALPKRRNHNRLTSDRLIKLLTLASRIEDSELRSEIVEQLNGGH
ncbi:MAG TPA: hypothetical protein DDW85_00760 [Porphyromonadaceae bacterium]|nr:hypothetical protein [Porphyromonadaceae bacterium]